MSWQAPGQFIKLGLSAASVTAHELVQVLTTKATTVTITEQTVSPILNIKHSVILGGILDSFIPETCTVRYSAILETI